ncbi:urease subunit beta 2 [Brucella sp. 63/311]|nr:urease subunit beta 2 [Brucella sp. 63/311]
MAKEPTKAAHPQPEQTKTNHKAHRPVGGYVLAKDPIEINQGRPRTTLTVRNTGDRPIQIGSHFHFFEVNRYLEFDRSKAFGLRLDIPANTAVRSSRATRRK